MDIAVLGPLRVTAGERALRLPAKQQVLLAILALDPNATVSTDRLMAALWGEDVSPTALRTLHSHVFQLRRALADGRDDEPSGPGRATVETDGRGYRLQIAPSAVDAQRFETLLSEARSTAVDDRRGAVSGMRAALALWRGPGLPDVGGEAVATARLDRLVELRHAAFDELVRLRLALGETADTIPDLRRELREYRYREPLWASLMLALASSGRRPEALLAYREACDALREELDVEPSEELQALAASIRAGSKDQLAGAVPHQTPAPPPELDSDAIRVASRGSRRSESTAAGRRVQAAVVGVSALALLLVGFLGTRLLPTIATTRSPRPLTADGPAPSVAVAPDSLDRIDRTGRVTSSIALGVQPEAIAIGAGSTWVTSPSDNLVVRVDDATSAVVQRIRVGRAPGGIAFGFGAVWVAAGDDGTVERIDPMTNEVVARIDVGAAPSGVATDGRWVWVANRLDHTVTRIDPEDGTTSAYAIGGSPLGVVAAAGSIWVLDADDSLVARVDPASGAVERTVAVGSDPTAITASPGGDAVWVVNTGSGTVFRIDTGTTTVTTAQPVGARPTGIAVDGDTVWVAVSSTNELVQLDAATGHLFGRETTSVTPRTLAVDGGGVAFTAGTAAGSHRGGTLRVVAMPGDMPDGPDPTYERWGMGGLGLLTNDALVTYKRVAGPDGLTIVPDLAAELPEPQDGGRVWTFHLRPGLTYSDGRPVRASDALGSFERAVIAANVTGGIAGTFGNTDIVGSDRCSTAPPCDLSAGVRTDDFAGTITFTLGQSDLAFPDQLVGVPIVPAGTPLTEVSTPLVATGPYVVAALEPGTGERVVRNPAFHQWSADAQPDGNPDEIAVTTSNLADPSVEVVSGAADVLRVETAASSRLAQLRTQVPGQLHVASPVATWFEMMNTTVPPFDDPRVRQAVNLATDRAALVEAWGGPLTATVTCQVVPPAFSGYARYCPWTVDPGPNGNWVGPDLDRARSLIDLAGVAGSRVTVWGADDGGQHAAVARSFTDLLNSLGFKATTRLMPFTTYFSFLHAHPEQVQMAGYYIRADERTAARMITDGFTCAAQRGPNGDVPAEWCDAALDGKIQTAKSLEDTDPIGAGEDWARIDHAIVDAAPAVMAFTTTDVTLLSARVGGFEDHPTLFLYDQLWVK